MKIEEVAKKKPVDRFLYWIRERHKIYLKRKAGRQRPWTDDEVLQSYFFTNPYRENDKTTVWFRENIRDPLRNKPEVLFATVCFRWFNKIETGRLLFGGDPRFEEDMDQRFSIGCAFNLLVKWNPKMAVKRLRIRANDGYPVFTGAYMIKAGNGPKGCKIPNVCNALSNVWKNRKQILDDIEGGTLEDACTILKEFPYLGGFMSYEIVTDLRHTYLLENASDIMTWCNPGPGCKRGLARLEGRSIERKKIRLAKDWLDQMRKLLVIAQRRLKSLPPLEMREIEHSLCEWDKYERMRLNEGRSKRKYNGHN